MAITRISGEQSFGGRIGSAVGSGISGLLDNLAMQKAKELEQRNNAKGYEQAWNLTPEQSKFIASQSPEFQQDFVKALHAQQQSEAFQRAIGGAQQQPDLAQNMGNMIQPQQPQQSLQDTMGGMGGQQIPQDAILMALQKGLGGQGQGQPAPTGMQQPQMQSQEQAPQAPQPQGRSIADIMRNAPLNPNLQAKVEELKLKKESNATKDRTSSYKVVQKKIESAQDLAAQADKEIKNLENVKKLNDSGQLKTGKKRQVLEKFGLENWFTNAPTEVAAKILAELKTGVAGAFGPGTRPTNFLVSEYDKQLPRLINSKEGLDALLKNRILSKKAEKIVGHNVNKLQNEIERTRSPYPFNIIEQAREMSQPRLDALAQESAKNMDDAIALLDKKSFKGKAREFETLPPAKDYYGKTARNPSTGQKLKSDGNKWIPVKE